MMGMVPNIYLLKYLNGKGLNVPEVEKMAKRYMKIGYDREQKYRFPDGSYSVWGPKTDDTGSMWLTSFVVKAFVQASRYIKVDKKSIMESMYWIIKQQGEDGCFQNKGYALHQELKGDPTSLSAAVLVTLIEARYVIADWKPHFESNSPRNSLDLERFGQIIDKAYRCVQRNVSDDGGDDDKLYLRSMVTYASTLYHGKAQEKEVDLDRSEKLLNELVSVANTSMPGKLYWSTGEQNKARDVEITAYNILSLTLQNKLAEALQAIRWLVTNRNSYGGFVSTQDTMVALQAIAEYSLKISSEKNDLDVDVVLNNVGENAVEVEKKFPVNEDNKLILQKEKFTGVVEPASEMGVTVTASGNGCFMVQTILRYNINDSPNKQGFNLVIKQAGEEMKVCANYTGSKQTDMVVIEIELLSGYTPYLKSLEKLFKQKASKYSNDVNYVPVKKYEYDEKEQKIVLYYDEMLKNTNCYDIQLKKVTEIKDIKPAIASIYDYYNTKNIYSTSYSV